MTNRTPPEGFDANRGNRLPPLWGDCVASDPLALVALALFCGMVAIWCAILE